MTIKRSILAPVIELENGYLDSKTLGAIHCLEAELDLLKREYIDAQREGILLGLTQAYTRLVANNKEDALKQIKQLIEHLSWDTET